MLTKSGVPILLFLFLSVAARSQTVQWASRVIDYSSQLTQVQYAADQVLGKPNVLPAGGENPNAWTPERDNREEFIKVGFENPLPIRQIAIAESYHPSALTAIYIYDENDAQYILCIGFSRSSR